MFEDLTEKIIGCAIEVHKNLGPGLLEMIYENALCIEFLNNKINFEKQKATEVKYKDISVGNYKVDILVENKVVIELKSVDRHDPIFEPQSLSYMKFGNYKVGLLINFNKQFLKDGVQRFVL
jgi:GxxExxY protein